MKNDKFCFSKGTGLIALVGVLLVGFVLFTQVATNTQTSTNSKASGVSCNTLGGLRTTQTCAAFFAAYYPTPATSASYQVADVTSSVTTAGFTGNCCKITGKDGFDCSAVANTLKEQNKTASTGRMYSCTYYTGEKIIGRIYNNTVANDCATKVVNDYSCAGMNNRLTPAAEVSPFTTPMVVDQKAYCGNLPSENPPGIKNVVSEIVSSVVPYGSATGTPAVTVSCRYYNGNLASNRVQGKNGCSTSYTADSTVCAAVGSTITTATGCSTKKCTNGLLGNGTCVKVGTNTEGLKCVCSSNTSTTELPRSYSCN